MISLEKKVFNDFNLFLAGDIHWGSRMHHAEGWEMLCDMLNEPYDGLPSTRNFVALHGDTIEGIKIDDPRFNPNITDPNILGMIDYAADQLRKIKSKIIVELDGNHPQKLWTITGNPDKGVAWKICKKAGIPYGTYACRVKYVDSKGRLLFNHYLTHGRKAISSTADDIRRRVVNMELILKRHMRDIMGDCVLMSKGHNHLLLCCRPVSQLYLTSDEDGIVKQAYTESAHTASYIHPDHRWYFGTGGFRKSMGDGFSDYAEIAGYPPTELGFWVVKIRNRVIVDAEKIVLRKPTAEMIEIPLEEVEEISM